MTGKEETASGFGRRAGRLALQALLCGCLVFGLRPTAHLSGRSLAEVLAATDAMAAGGVAVAETGPAVAVDLATLERTEDFLSLAYPHKTDIPEDIRALEGHVVKIKGYFMVPAETFVGEEPIGHFALARNAYGCPCCTWGPPPTIFNTVVVNMNNGDKLMPPFEPMYEVSGVFEIKIKQYSAGFGRKNLEPLFYLNDARVVRQQP